LNLIDGGSSMTCDNSLTCIEEYSLYHRLNLAYYCLCRMCGLLFNLCPPLLFFHCLVTPFTFDLHLPFSGAGWTMVLYSHYLKASRFRMTSHNWQNGEPVSVMKND
jgi:hypothetical protein